MDQKEIEIAGKKILRCIHSCEHVDQLRSCRRMIDNLAIYGEPDKFFVLVAQSYMRGYFMRQYQLLTAPEIRVSESIKECVDCGGVVFPGDPCWIFGDNAYCIECGTIKFEH